MEMKNLKNLLLKSLIKNYNIFSINIINRINQLIQEKQSIIM